MHEQRVDPVLGTRVHIVRTRRERPNLPVSGCPFCVGGLEAPEPYVVRHFQNRWPAMEDGRCEVVLFTPHHDATFGSLSAGEARRVVDLWSERTAELGARDDVDYVLVFENRGAEVGATIAHPHGQIYAYDHVPSRQLRRLEQKWAPDVETESRRVAERDGWLAWVPYAPVFPVSFEIAPLDRIPDLPSMEDFDRDVLASMLVDVLRRLDLLYERPVPYMLWLNQRPTITSGFHDSWFNVEIVSPWRSAGVHRFIAAAEVASEEYFNEVVPEDLAARLREIGRASGE